MIDSNAFGVNVRTAYRLLYEVQKSILDAILYIRTRLQFSDSAGTNLFSDTLEKRKPALDEWANIKIDPSKWAWDYFNGYMMDYYFSSCPDKPSCLSITQVMDDGFGQVKKIPSAILDTSQFTSVEEAKSFLLFTFGFFSETDQNVLWYYNITDSKEIRDGVFYIANQIDESADGVFDISDEGRGRLICWKVGLEAFANKDAVDSTLEQFNDIVKVRTGKCLLKP